LTDYRIFETRQFQKDLKTLSKAGHPKIAARLRASVYPELRQRPGFSTHIRKLRDYEPPTWRYRIGDWRIFYEIDSEERIVFLIAVAHRGSAY
jgi:mRNA interferase RelE/StbE